MSKRSRGEDEPRWIAVAGDVHGAFDKLAALLERFTRATGHALDLILQVGDLEPHRDARDLESLIAPEGSIGVGDFPAYASGAKKLPAELVCIGGNHEPWAFLESTGSGELAPGFHFLGRAGRCERLGLEIAGLSGIYHPRHSERPREAAGWERATFFAREDVAALLQLDRVDVLLLHDWPTGILEPAHRARVPGLIPGVDAGNEAARLLVERLRPRWVFCGHRHVAYARDLVVDDAPVHVRCLADVPHGDAGAVTFLQLARGELAESAPLEELEAFAHEGGGGRSRGSRKRRA